MELMRREVGEMKLKLLRYGSRSRAFEDQRMLHASRVWALNQVYMKEEVSGSSPVHRAD